MSTAQVRRLVKEGFVPVKEACAFLGLSKTAMYDLLKSNAISHIRWHGRKLVSKQALEDFAAARLVIGKVA